jgi:hypothetical protein
MPNTLSRAFDAIDGLADDGALRPDDCAVLKAFYAAGWQDGFVTGATDVLSRALGITERRLSASIDALSKIQAVALRRSADDDLMIELLALSRPWMAGDIALGWWRYHLVDDESGEIEGPSAA